MNTISSQFASALVLDEGTVRSSLPTGEHLKRQAEESREPSCCCFGSRKVAKKPAASAALALANILQIPESRKKTTPIRLNAKDINEAIKAIYAGANLIDDVVIVLKETKEAIKRDRVIQQQLKLSPVTTHREYLLCVQFLTQVADEVGVDVCELFRKTYSRDVEVTKKNARDLLTDPVNQEEFLRTCRRFNSNLLRDDREIVLRSFSTIQLRNLLERAITEPSLSELVRKVITEREEAMNTIMRSVETLKNESEERRFENKVIRFLPDLCVYWVRGYTDQTCGFNQLLDAVERSFEILDIQSRRKIHANLKNETPSFDPRNIDYRNTNLPRIKQGAFIKLCSKVGYIPNFD